jgi:hypothetical protein
MHTAVEKVLIEFRFLGWLTIFFVVPSSRVFLFANNGRLFLRIFPETRDVDAKKISCAHRPRQIGFGIGSEVEPHMAAQREADRDSPPSRIRGDRIGDTHEND